MARFLALPLALAGAGGCDKSDGILAGPEASVTASIDGTSWTATSIVLATHVYGVLAFSGLDGAQTEVRITVPSVSTPGTYYIGAGQLGSAVVTENGETWSTNLPGGTGSVTIMTLTADRATGIFTFAAVPAPGNGATETKAVTLGTFDVSF